MKQNIKSKIQTLLSENSENLLPELINACKNSDLKIYKQNFYPQDNHTKQIIEGESGFKYAHSSKFNYHFYVSDIGRLLFVYCENPNKTAVLKNEIFNYQCWFFTFDDYGHYIDEELNIKYDKTLNLYTFVAEAWLNDSYIDGYECHHINNDPNDNRVENLIYLPKSVHSQIPSRF